MSRTEREIVKSLRQLGKSIKQDPVREKESYDMLLSSFREMFPCKTKLTYNFYLSLKPVAVSLLALIFVFISGFGLLFAAKNTLPGNFLYPVKRVAEKGRMALVLNQSQKTVLRAEILTNRLSEVKILTEKIEKGDKKLEPELQDLAQNFTNDLKVLTKHIGDQVKEDGGPVEPLDSEPVELFFPDEDLLEFVQLPDQGSLPIQDQRQVFTIMPTDDLERLLSETKELLAEENLVLAFVKLQQAENLVLEQEEPKTEEDVSPDQEPEPEQEPEQDETYIIDEEIKEALLEQPIVPEQPLNEEPVESPEPIIDSVKDDLSGSMGQILLKQEIKQDFTGGMKRAKDAKTGMIRE